MTKQQRENADDAKYNRIYTVAAITRYYQRQNSSLLMSEAHELAKHDYDRGLRWNSRLGVPA